MALVCCVMRVCIFVQFCVCFAMCAVPVHTYLHGGGGVIYVTTLVCTGVGVRVVERKVSALIKK